MANRRVVDNNGSARDRLRRRVFREESVCHLCDQAVDVRLPRGRPGSPEVDHLVPVTHGGAVYDRRNAALAHKHCNRLRWHGPIAVARERLARDRPKFDTDGMMLSRTPTPAASRQWL